MTESDINNMKTDINTKKSEIELDMLNKIEVMLLKGNNPFELRKDVAALIIGLGGTGLTMVDETKALFTKRYKPLARLGVAARRAEEIKALLTKRDKPGDISNIKYLCIDTDKSALDSLKYVGPNERVQIQGFDLNNQTTPWLNPSFINTLNERGNLGLNSNGATIRMLGRWMLFSSEVAIIKTLKCILGEMPNLGPNDGEISEIYVIVAGSICGGTGSSCCIDIPYFVRKAAKDLGMADLRDDRHFQYYAMFELPDSKIPRTEKPDEAMMRARAYATLKELQYFMRFDNVSYTAVFGDKPNEPLTWRRPAYDICFLMSSNSVDLTMRIGKYKGRGKNYIEGEIPEAINIMLSKPLTVPGQDKPQGFSSFMGTVLTYRGQKKDAIGRELIVSTIGVSKIEVPRAQIVVGVLNRIFLALDARWEPLNDREQINDIIMKRIMPLFKIDGLVKIGTDFLNIGKISGLTIKELKSKDFQAEKYVNVKDERIRALPAQISGGIDVFEDAAKKEIDRIYHEYGPFLALKALEDNDEGYGKTLGKALDDLSKDYPFADISSAIAATNLGFAIGKDKEKQDEAVKELKETIKKSLINRYVIAPVREAVKGRREIINRIHNEDFTNVTQMVTQLEIMLKVITGVSTITETVHGESGEVFSWDFSKVSYDDIQSKIDSLFVKKVTVKDSPNAASRAIYTREKVMGKDEKGKDKEIFYHAEIKGRPPITVKIGGDTYPNKVIAVAEVLRWTCKKRDKFQRVQERPDEVGIEELIIDFLDKVKQAKPKSKDDSDTIVAVMLISFWKIINLFADTQFEEQLLMSSPGWKFQDPPREISQTEREKLFKGAIQRYKTNANPSYPVRDEYVNDLIKEDRRSFAISLEPPLTSDDIITNEVRKGVIGESLPIIKDNISMMIDVNFFFHYSLSWYVDLKKCREEYNKIKDKGLGYGLHLAEGPGEDWRKMLEDIPDLPTGTEAPAGV
jgi:hypothetical protein